MTATEQNRDLVLEQSAEDYWNRYQLTFALYSVSDRAIPSAFDGLKPGQRRLLYQMHASKLLPGNKPQKSSKVCSAVTGNLHPHGGAAMYGAAALLAADFQRAFGEAPGPVLGVALMTDSDNTGGQAQAWYADIALLPPTPR